MPGHSVDGGGIKKGGVVFEDTVHSPFYFQRQIKLAFHLRHLEGLEIETAPIYFSTGLQQVSDAGGLLRLLKDEEDLKKRRAAWVAPGMQTLDEQRKRQILMRKRAQHHLTNLVQELLEGGISAEIRPHDYRVDEVTDDAGEFSLAPARGRRAYQDVFLARVAVKQYLKGRQQHHVNASRPQPWPARSAAAPGYPQA